jgi:hypothetical protein
VQVLETIRGEFPELKIVMADQLMFVKEDLIIPQHNTFYVSVQLCLFLYVREERKKHFVDFWFFSSFYVRYSILSSAAPQIPLYWRRLGSKPGLLQLWH